MGFTEIVHHLPRIYREFRKLKRAIRTRRPTIAILIDFPEIPFRLAKELQDQVPGVREDLDEAVDEHLWLGGGDGRPREDRMTIALLGGAAVVLSALDGTEPDVTGPATFGH